MRDWCEFAGPLIDQSEVIPMQWILSWKNPISQDTMCCIKFQITTAQESTDMTHWCSLLSGSPSKAYTLTLGNKDLSVYYSMNGEEFRDCIGGGWTLVMKINDKQVMQTCWGLQNAITNRMFTLYHLGRRGGWDGFSCVQ